MCKHSKYGVKQARAASTSDQWPEALYTHTHAHAHARTHARARARTHARTHAHTHSHTHPVRIYMWLLRPRHERVADADEVMLSMVYFTPARPAVEANVQGYNMSCFHSLASRVWKEAFLHLPIIACPMRNTLIHTPCECEPSCLEHAADRPESFSLRPNFQS